jgi:hypothetical protein
MQDWDDTEPKPAVEDLLPGVAPALPRLTEAALFPVNQLHIEQRLLLGER